MTFPTPPKLLTYLFADDTQGLASGKNLPELIDRVNNELKKWASWFISNKMSVNVNKTKYIIFHTEGKKIPPSLNQVVFDCNIPNTPHDPSLVYTLDCIHNKHPSLESQTYKLLGVYLDENLSVAIYSFIVKGKMTGSLHPSDREHVPVNTTSHIFRESFTRYCTTSY